MLNPFKRKKIQPEVTSFNGGTKVFNYNKHLRGRAKRRALLCYLPDVVVDDLTNQPTVRFSNEGIGRTWPRVLNELGFIVDVINWDDADFKARNNYDLLVLHGAKNPIYKKVGREKTIHFLTGTYWRFNNTQEAKRLSDFAKRHQVKLPPDRFISASEDKVNEIADGIIVIGNSFTRHTYDKYQDTFAINNANYPDNHFDKFQKNYKEGRKNWLFFAGAGNVHKGLDLVIEAFAHLKQNLYVITPLEKRFVSVYKKEAKLPNINLIGEVPMRTEEFYEIVDKCAFQIFPSCSEGQPGSVVEAMNQGVIPVVSKESGLSANHYGEILKENTVECIRESVERFTYMEPDKVEAMAKKVREVALKYHNPEKFRKDLKNAVYKIVNDG